MVVLKQAPVQIKCGKFLKHPDHWSIPTDPLNTKRVVLNVKLYSNYGTLFKVTSINDEQFFD